MRSLALFRAAFALALVLGLGPMGPTGLWPALGLARAADSPAATGTPPATEPQTVVADNPGATLERAQGFERRQLWGAAVAVYRDALIHWPSRNDFKQRLRLCEMHLRLARRYADTSFRNVLLRLPREKALDLFQEIVERIETHYVDTVPLEPMLRRGLDNLEVALRDPNFAFLRLNAPGAVPNRLQWLRQELRNRRDHLSVPDAATAQAIVSEVCELGRTAVGLPAAAVVLEFVFGSCDVLDEYTVYLTPDKLDDMFATIDGNFVGLGLELKQDDQGLRIVGVLHGGPASEAGLKVGDRIAAINGQPLRGLGLDEAASRLQGTEGSTVDVGIRHSDETSQMYRMVRRHVEVESIAQSKILDPTLGIGYIQLIGFQKTSLDELDRAMTRLQRQGLRHLVLDLRGNPGGLLNVAVDIADRFVDHGTIVSTRGRAPGQTQVFRAKPDQPYTCPMTVLVDRDSASASEILAGALQELDRAEVVGDRSFGKGSVQSIFELRTVPAGLKLTTAKFYSPTNRPYSETGVEPNVQARLSARPPLNLAGAGASAEAEADSEPQEFGNPATDPVLGLALQRAKGQMAVSRR